MGEWTCPELQAMSAVMRVDQPDICIGMSLQECMLAARADEVRPESEDYV
jgi:hypothetical protein